MCAQLFQLCPTLATPWAGILQAPLSIGLNWQEYWSRLSFPSPLCEYFCYSVAQLCPTLCDPMDCSTSGVPVPHHLPKFSQVHVHCISDAVQPSHPLMPSIFPSIRDFSNVLPVHIRLPKYWSFSFSINPSSDYSGLSPLRLTGFISLLSGDFQESSPASQSKGINSLAFCLLYSPAFTTVCDHWEDHSLDYMDLCQQSNVSAFQHTV